MTRISGTGCSLMDYLYTNVDFSSPAFRKGMALRSGDGGLETGKLVFLEDFERFSGRSFAEFCRDVTGGRKPDKANLGGPSIVALINAAQLLEGSDCRVGFYGGRGRDAAGDELMAIIAKTPLDVSEYAAVEGMTPFTEVFSDPAFDNGHGERTFVNNIGAAWNYRPEDIPDAFFDTDIAAFGGTGLVPRIHDGLTGLAARAKKAGAVTLVNTVYDFRNQARDPVGRWPLGESEETYRHVDVLVADREEAMRLSGERDVDRALEFFRSRGTGAVVVTEGSREIAFYADGSLFAKTGPARLPVSAEVTREIADPAVSKGDTTGCGDNFAGGLLASIAQQLEAGTKRGRLDLVEACSWAVASGGFSCFHVGGTYLESRQGEKRSKIERYYNLYRKQIGVS